MYSVPTPPPLRNALSSTTIHRTSSPTYHTPPQPRPSPTKRAYSSPSPTSSPVLQQGEPDESPRVSRARFSKEDGWSSSSRTATTSVLAPADELLGTPDTPPSPMGDKLVGLGVGMESRSISEKDASSEGRSQYAPVKLTTPEEQTKRLMEMPQELSSALNRLCSQHHNSEYNTLKRVVAAQASQQAAPAFSHLAPPVTSASLQRSHSTPPVPSSPQKPATTLPPRPVVLRSKTAASTTPTLHHPYRPPTFNLPNGSQSLPPHSRVSTPPPSALSRAPSSQSTKSTSLTPVLASVGFADKKDLPPPPKDIAEALTEALKSDMPGFVKDPPAVVAVATQQIQPVQLDSNGMLPGMEVMNGVAVKTSASHPMNISAMIPPDQIVKISGYFFASQTPAKPKSPLMPSASLSYNASPSLTSEAPSSRPFIISSPSTCDLWSMTTQPPPALSINLQPEVPTEPVPARLLGNFLLSSCPGKKVRLGVAPVKGGRSAICRDVKMDLQRAKDEGVKLVVCCLDDLELGYLGAPWDEYAKAISFLNLEVIRLPMVEGYAPPSCSILDSHLERIIKNHTLKGESVLAHCRGGIGRAGLVACCWTIKCGFVSARKEGDDGEEGLGEAMRVVEQVIELIRRRRSVKAIETALQVNFLLQYVTYLKDARTKIINSATDL